MHILACRATVGKTVEWTKNVPKVVGSSHLLGSFLVQWACRFIAANHIDFLTTVHF